MSTETTFLRWLYYHPEFGPDPELEQHLHEIFEQETGLTAPLQVFEFDEYLYRSEGDTSLYDDDNDEPPYTPSTHDHW